MTMRIHVSSLALLVIALTAPTSGARDVSFDDDMRFLLTCTTQYWYLHNIQLVTPDHDSGPNSRLRRLADSPDPKTAHLARMVLIRDYYVARHIARKEDKESLNNIFVGRWRQAVLSGLFNGIIGKDVPTMKEAFEGDLGPLIRTFDDMRINEVSSIQARIAYLVCDAGIAAHVEGIYSNALAGRRLPQEPDLIVDGNPDWLETMVEPPGGGAKLPLDGHNMRVTYKGDEPLTNVALITKNLPKPISQGELASIAELRALSEAVDPGAKRNEDASDYNLSNLIMLHVPKAYIVYLPKLEKGDIIHMCLCGSDFNYSTLEANFTLCSDQGMIRNLALARADTRNFRPRNSFDRNVGPVIKVLPKIDKPTPTPSGPKFARVNKDSRVFAILRSKKDGSRMYSFEGCVPAGSTFVGTGQNLDVKYNDQSPPEVVASDSKFVVAKGPARPRGHALVLIPRSQVEKTTTISTKPKTPKRARSNRR